MKLLTRLLFFAAALLPECALVISSPSTIENIKSASYAVLFVVFSAMPSLLVFMCALVAKSKVFTILCLAVNMLLAALYMKVIFEPLGGFAYGGVGMAQLLLAFALMPISYFLSEVRG